MGDSTERARPVVIVGGGPVGMGLAIDLAQRGIRCVVVERYKEPQPIPKGQNLTQRTMEHFHFWGAEADLRAARTIPREYGIGGLTAYGTLRRLSAMTGCSANSCVLSISRTMNGCRNMRPSVLRERAAQIPPSKPCTAGQARRCARTRPAQASISSIAMERDGVVRADYVVGCDGSRSLVRDEAGIAQTRSDHDRLMVLLVFRSTGLHGLLERFPGKSFYNVLHPDLEGYWQFFGRVDLGETWFFHAPVPADTTRENFDFRRLCRTPPAPSSTSTSNISAFGTCASRSPTAIARAGSSSPATRRTAIRPMAATGSTAASRMPQSRLEARGSAEGWAGPGLLDSYERNGGRFRLHRARLHREVDRRRSRLSPNARPGERPRRFRAAWRARSPARREVNAFEPHYEGSPIVAGPAGAASAAIGSHACRPRRPSSLSSAALLWQERLRRARKGLYPDRPRRGRCSGRLRKGRLAVERPAKSDPGRRGRWPGEIPVPPDPRAARPVYRLDRR